MTSPTEGNAMGRLVETLYAQERARFPQHVLWARRACDGTLDAFETGLRRSLAAMLVRADDEATAQAFHAAAPWPGAGPEHYKPRVTLPGALCESGFVVAVRFASRAGRLVPYVTFEAGGAHAAHLDASRLALLLEPFRSFASQGRLECRAKFFEGEDMPETFLPRTHHVVGVPRLREAPLGSADAPSRAAAERRQEERLRLAPSDGDFRFFADYVAAYDHFHRLRPALKHSVPAESLESFRTWAQEGVVRVVQVDGRFGGVFAAQPGELSGAKGFFFMEKCLDPRLWGTGLGAAAERVFVRDHLPAGEALLGEIDAQNAASLRTALRLGRRIVATVAVASVPV